MKYYYEPNIGANFLINALMGNFSLLRVDLNGNQLLNTPSGSLLISRISNYLDRNNYYVKDLLVQDMSQLVFNSSF